MFWFFFLFHDYLPWWCWAARMRAWFITVIPSFWLVKSCEISCLVLDPRHTHSVARRCTWERKIGSSMHPWWSDIELQLGAAPIEPLNSPGPSSIKFHFSLFRFLFIFSMNSMAEKKKQVIGMRVPCWQNLKQGWCQTIKDQNYLQRYLGF